MKGLEYRDNRMKCELFYLNDPSCAEKPYLNPEPEVTVVQDFKVKDFNEVIKFTKEWNEKHPEHVHYWRYKHDRSDCGLWHKDGVCSFGFNDVDEWFNKRLVKYRIQLKKLKEDFAKPETQADELKRVHCCNNITHVLSRVGRLRKMSANKFWRGLVQAWISTCDWCGWYLKDKWVDKFTDWKWKREKISTWKKTGHSPDEWWSLELHLLDTLKFNLKKIIKDGMGINSIFIEDVLRKRHANEPDFDLEKEFIKFHMGRDTGVEDEAVELQNQTYERICHLIDLYTFYLNQEVDDKDIYGHPELRTPDMVETYIDGTYDMIDYKDMLEKATKCWDEIWDLVKKYGQQMGD